MKYEAVIFDLDGTIINTEPMWVAAAITMLKNAGKTIPDNLHAELTEKMRGLGAADLGKLLQDDYQLPGEKRALVHELCTRARGHYGNEIVLMPGFVEFQRTLTERGTPQAIATNADDETLALVIKKFDLRKYFGKHIYNPSVVNNVIKPHPALYVYTAKQLGIKPEKCVAIEDSQTGVASAKAAGMYCVGLAQVSNRTKLQQADVIVDRYVDIKIDALLS